MSFFTEKQGEIEHEYFQAGPGKKIYLGRKDKPGSAKLENIRKALGYLDQKNQHYLEITDKLISKLSSDDRDKILPEMIDELYKKADAYIKSLSDPLKQKYLSRGKETAEDQTRLRPLTKSLPNLSKAKVVVYGLSTEGYSLASKMAIKGANVSIIDESSQSAISLKPEIAKTYPTITSLKQDEVLLTMNPIDIAISTCDFLFFAPRIRYLDKNPKKHVHLKFKDVAVALRKGISVIFMIPTGIGGNAENCLIMEQMSGLKVGKDVFYYYYPVGFENSLLPYVGSANNDIDDRLAKLLDIYDKNNQVKSIHTIELIHKYTVLDRFSKLLPIDKSGKQIYSSKSIFTKIKNLFLADFVNGLFDLRMISTSQNHENSITESINVVENGIKQYVEKTVKEILYIINKNKLDLSSVSVMIVWSPTSHEIRGDRYETLHLIAAKLSEHVPDVKMVSEYEVKELELAHDDKYSIIITCSKTDFEKLKRVYKTLPYPSGEHMPILTIKK